MLSFSSNFFQQYILLAKTLFLVSDSMFRRISNALKSYFGLPAMSWMCLFNLLIFLCELVTNLFSCVSQLRRVSCLLFDSSKVQLFWQRSLVTSVLRVTAFCVTSFYRIVGDLTPTLVQNFIFNSMNLPCESHFELFLITNGNVVTDFPFLNLVTTHRLF